MVERRRFVCQLEYYLNPKDSSSNVQGSTKMLDQTYRMARRKVRCHIRGIYQRGLDGVDGLEDGSGKDPLKDQSKKQTTARHTCPFYRKVFDPAYRKQITRDLVEI